MTPRRPRYSPGHRASAWPIHAHQFADLAHGGHILKGTSGWGTTARPITALSPMTVNGISSGGDQLGAGRLHLGPLAADLAGIERDSQPWVSIF